MSEPIPSLPDQYLCPHCCAVNPPEAHFCASCNAPLSVFATTDPMGRIQSAGFAYRRATHQKPRGIVVAGIWLIFVPGFLTFATVAVFSLGGLVISLGLRGNGFLGMFIMALGALAVSGGLAALFGTIIYRTTRNYWTAPPDSESVDEDDDSMEFDEAEPEAESGEESEH